MTVPRIGLRDVSKRFGVQLALDGVSLGFRSGEIHGLAGMNGSGKSTLVKVLAGVYAADSGTVHVDGRDVPDMTPGKARELGLRFLHQEPAVIPTLSVADNIALGAMYPQSSDLWVRTKRELAASREVFARLGIEGIDPRMLVQDLSPAQRTMVAIARAVQDISSSSGLLVLDEPTASLPVHEAELVTGLVRRVASAGLPVLYITHDLETLIQLSDRVSVLRDGRLVETERADELNERRLAELMAGSDRLTRAARPRSQFSGAHPVLTCRGLSGGRVSDVDFESHAGEVVGIAGLLGSGRSTLLRLVAGAQSRTGSVSVAGVEVPGGSPRVALQHGIALVPEDRRGQAAFAGMTLAENLTVASMAQVAKPWWISRRRERRRVTEQMDAFDVRPRLPDRHFSLLSGGNQQKAIISRATQMHPRVLLLDEPTQGVDVHARAQIHSAIAELAKGGLAVIVVSSDLEELILISDRTLVMRRGVIQAEASSENLTETDLLHLTAVDEVLETT
jgi:ribose transport system ATP-binding protein